MNIEIRDLNVKYLNKNKKSAEKYAHILKDISLDIKLNKFNAIIGPSGGGKTTFIKTLAGEVPMGSITSGSIKIDNEDRDYNDWHRNTILLEQEEESYHNLTVLQACMRVLELNQNNTRKENLRLVDDITKKFVIHKSLYKRMSSLSGGELKRTNIVLALLCDRKYVFLDEPTSGLDDITAYKIIEHLKQLTTEQDKTVLITIHQPSIEVLDMIDNLVFISAGSLFYSGKIEDSIEYLESFDISNTRNRTPAFFMLEASASEDLETKESFKKMSIAYNRKFKTESPEKNAINANYYVRDLSFNLRSAYQIFKDFLNPISSSNFKEIVVSYFSFIFVFLNPVVQFVEDFNDTPRKTTFQKCILSLYDMFNYGQATTWLIFAVYHSLGHRGLASRRKIIQKELQKNYYSPLTFFIGTFMFFSHIIGISLFFELIMLLLAKDAEIPFKILVVDDMLKTVAMSPYLAFIAYYEPRNTISAIYMAIIAALFKNNVSVFKSLFCYLENIFRKNREPIAPIIFNHLSSIQVMKSILLYIFGDYMQECADETHDFVNHNYWGLDVWMTLYGEERIGLGKIIFRAMLVLPLPYLLLVWAVRSKFLRDIRYKLGKQDGCLDD